MDTLNQKKQVHWTWKCILNWENHNGNYMVLNEAIIYVITP